SLLRGCSALGGWRDIFWDASREAGLEGGFHSGDQRRIGREAGFSPICIARCSARGPDHSLHFSGDGIFGGPARHATFAARTFGFPAARGDPGRDRSAYGRTFRSVCDTDPTAHD